EPVVDSLDELPDRVVYRGAGRVARHVGDRRAVEAYAPILAWDRRGDAPRPPPCHAALAALARPGHVLRTQDPARAVADADWAGQRAVACAGQPHRSGGGGHASSARSIRGGPSPGFCSTGRSPPARSTNRGYCSRNTTGTSPVGPLRCFDTIRSASLGSAS